MKKPVLEVGKRYLFTDYTGYKNAWSGTVLEVAETHVRIQYDSGNISWIERDDYEKYGSLVVKQELGALKDEKA